MPATIVLLLGTALAPLSCVVAAPPASAVPVDGVYTGTAVNAVHETVTAVEFRVSTTAPTRDVVSMSVDLPAGLRVYCMGRSASIPATAVDLVGVGGVASAAPPGTATITAMGAIEASGVDLPIAVGATLSPQRSEITGTAVVGLPWYCLWDTTLTFTAVSDSAYDIRTGHDGGQVGNGIDATHLVEREPVGSPTPWERCMYVFAVTAAGVTPPATAAARWAVEPGSPPGAHIKAGWATGDPGGPGSDPDPLSTQVCITDATPVDSLVVVTFAPTGDLAEGRVVLWVGAMPPT